MYSHLPHLHYFIIIIIVIVVVVIVLVSVIVIVIVSTVGLYMQLLCFLSLRATYKVIRDSQ